MKTHFKLILSIGIQAVDRSMVVNVDLKFCIQTGMIVINMFFVCKKPIKVKVALSGVISRKKK